MLRHRAWPWVVGGAVLGVASLVGSWAAGLFSPHQWRTLALLAQGAILNAALFAAVLWVRDRFGARRARLAQLRRELGYFRAWASEEGILRKEGLIRDINALGEAPGDLAEAVLRGARLSGADLRGATLNGCDLSSANLQGALLEDAALWGANLAGADLTRSNLRGANLRGCNLENAQLVKASLDGANLHRANLVNANFEGVRLADTRLERARFAPPERGALPQTVHSSIEDWIRERLDNQGRYREPDSRDCAPETEEG